MICTAIVLFSGLAWAYIIGEVGAIVTDMTSEGQDFRRTMHHLNSMMKRQGNITKKTTTLVAMVSLVHKSLLEQA